MYKGKDKRGRGGGDTQISKTLSWILRHGAVQQGLTIQSSGYVPLDQVMQCLKRKGCKNVDQERIRHIVDNNDKKRFEIEQRKHYKFIRATQGHSMKQVNTQQLLTKITDPLLYPTVVHGTFMKFWGLIKNQGLKRMTRNHIHFAPGLPKQQGVISGMRGSCDIIIEIDLNAAIKDGIDFYISSNNVILTQGVDGVLGPQYFLRVTKKDGTLIQGRQQNPFHKVIKQEVKQEKKKEQINQKSQKQVEIKPQIRLNKNSQQKNEQ